MGTNLNITRVGVHGILPFRTDKYANVGALVGMQSSSTHDQPPNS